MENTNGAKQNVDLIIKTDSILFFDMDGTLVDTNYANYLSYKKAIQSVILTDTDILYNPNERFNRGSLKRVVPNLTETEYNSIIQQKEEYYKEHLPQTKLNKIIADILIKYSKTNKTILVTNCHKDRALMTLNYHRLTDEFSSLFYGQMADNETRTNKYKNAILCLGLLAQVVVVFENEQIEIADAIKAGIPSKNILSL